MQRCVAGMPVIDLRRRNVSRSNWLIDVIRSCAINTDIPDAINLVVGFGFGSDPFPIGCTSKTSEKFDNYRRHLLVHSCAVTQMPL